MTETIKGIIEIPKLSFKETEDDYKTAIAERLYDLLVAYHAKAKEINLPPEDDDYNSPERYSRMCEEPETPDKDAPPQYYHETHKQFINHHFLYGWNRTLPFENFNHPEQTFGETTAHDGNFIHWLRTTEKGERKQLDVYLLKYHEHPIINNEGVNFFNGIVFAERYKPSTYKKIKNVLQTARRVLLANARQFTSIRIERQTITEILTLNTVGILEWTLEERVRKRLL